MEKKVNLASPKVGYIYRSKDRNEFSIEILFDCFKKYVKKKYIIVDYYLPKCHYNNIKDLLKNYRDAKKYNSDIYHITGEINFIALALPKKKTIITIHDFVDLENNKGIKKVLRYLLWYYLPLHHCRYIGCISHKVYNELIERFPFTKNKVFYVPNPINDMYKAVDKNFSKIPRILLIGTRENKNIERVFKAVNNINCELYIVGKLNDMQKELLKNNNIKYINVFNITDEEVRQAYIDCDIVCFPSTYEGFGRPIIEANAIGRPVITSNIEPMIEVGANAAVFVDPYDIESIRNGILKVIENKELRKKIIEEGFKNVEKYRPENIANIYMNYYEKVK